jgi:hypothetical protein
MLHDGFALGLCQGLLWQLFEVLLHFYPLTFSCAISFICSYVVFVLGLWHVSWFEPLDKLLLKSVTIKGSKLIALFLVSWFLTVVWLHIAPFNIVLELSLLLFQFHPSSSFHHCTGAVIAPVSIPPFILNIFYSCVPCLKTFSLPLFLDL